MSNEELMSINGGNGVNATIINAVIRGITFTVELGRMLGTIIRRKMEKKIC